MSSAASNMNTWLTNRIMALNADKLNVKLFQPTQPKKGASKPPGNVDKRRKKDEIDHYRFRVQHLRDETNALYQDLITFKRNKTDIYEHFVKENNSSIMQMIYEIRRAEEEIMFLEKELSEYIEGGDGKSGDKKRTAKTANTNAITKMDRDMLRSQQEEVKDALKTLKDIVMKLKEQLASFHNYVSAMQVDRVTYDSQGDQANGPDLKKKEKVKKYENILKELGIKPL